MAGPVSVEKNWAPQEYQVAEEFAELTSATAMEMTSTTNDFFSCAIGLGRAWKGRGRREEDRRT
jgi:hypothetical protein